MRDGLYMYSDEDLFEEVEGYHGWRSISNFLDYYQPPAHRTHPLSDIPNKSTYVLPKEYAL